MGFQVPQSKDLHIQQWNGDFFVYHDGAGSSHLLDSLSGQIINFVSHENLSLEEIISLLSGSISLSGHSKQDTQTLVMHYLSQLKGIELVEETL